jgi:hypothetical protein
VATTPKKVKTESSPNPLYKGDMVNHIRFNSNLIPLSFNNYYSTTPYKITYDSVEVIGQNTLVCPVFISSFFYGTKNLSNTSYQFIRNTGERSDYNINRSFAPKLLNGNFNDLAYNPNDNSRFFDPYYIDNIGIFNNKYGVRNVTNEVLLTWGSNVNPAHNYRDNLVDSDVFFNFNFFVSSPYVPFEETDEVKVICQPQDVPTETIEKGNYNEVFPPTENKIIYL